MHLQGCGCKQCATAWTDDHKNNHVSASRKSRSFTISEWIAKAKQVHNDKYDYSLTEYVNQRTSVKIICPIHGEFEQKADSHLRGIGCKRCGYEFTNRGDHSWCEKQRQKTAETCLERYGATRYLDSDEGRQKMKSIQETPEFRKRMKDVISSDAVQIATKRTCIAKYGVTSPMKLSYIRDKVGESKRKNGTWSTSKPEEKMYLHLLDVFSKDNVLRQYKDVRYPFHCDFYIKSLDLFIELNATWLHGKHWFDEFNEFDICTLSHLMNKVSNGCKFYQVAIDVWTKRDVAKRNTAIKNNLNYLVFWNNDLSDFNDWLYSDKHMLCNI